MSLDQVLSERPSLDELCEHVRLGNKWYKFGVLLKLDTRELDVIEELNNDVDYKALKMFQLWLNTTPDAIRKHVLNTLRKDVIGEMIVAEKYEKELKEHCCECNVVIYKYINFILHYLYILIALSTFFSYLFYGHIKRYSPTDGI